MTKSHTPIFGLDVKALASVLAPILAAELAKALPRWQASLPVTRARLSVPAVLRKWHVADGHWLRQRCGRGHCQPQGLLGAG